VNYRYTFDDKVYDVSKLTLEAVSCFKLLANVNDRIDDFQNEVTIAQASAVALHQKMQELLDDSAIIEEDETEE
tara:strand:+ start:231 stop:452 length:222 start_codon:yes stop_codon:yes gene_type:complete